MELKELSPIVLGMLRRRGVRDIARFFSPSMQDLMKPTELDGIAAAANEIVQAVKDGKRIVVFGDYDCDGVSATAILVKTLLALDADVSAFLPDRLTEGYGMSERSVARMLAGNSSVGLVVTVDNGINSVEQVAALKARGVSVVITDHHLPGEELPAADALVDPKVAAPEALDGLCGAGVAFLLAGAVIDQAKANGLYEGPNIGGPLLVLAGLATVTDIMPLTGQNRILVAEALKRFRAWAPIGLKELHERAARKANDALSAKDFGFMLGPRINAAGRMASAMEALELVLCEDRELARRLAQKVDLHNAERKRIEQEMTEQALAKVIEGAAAQVVDLPDGHPGVAGIVAARILEKTGVPVGVIASGHGSARAPAGYNVRDAFSECAELLDGFGGHAAAGGFTVKSGKVEEFREKFSSVCARQSESVPKTVGAIQFDAEVRKDDLTLEFARQVEAMAPFGEGNEEPVFFFRRTRIGEVRPLGSDGRHLAMTVNGFKAVWWGHGDRMEELRAHGSDLYDIYFTIEISDYGESHVELRLVEIVRK